MKEIVFDRALEIDLGNVSKLLRQIQERKDSVERQLRKKKDESDWHNPDDLKKQASKLVSAVLGETVTFMNAVPGPGRDHFNSRPEALQERVGHKHRS